MNFTMLWRFIYAFRWRQTVIIIFISTLLLCVIFNFRFPYQIKEQGELSQLSQIPQLQQLQLRPTKIDGLDIYVYTAVAVPISDGKTDIRIQAFRNIYEKNPLKCCFRNKHGADVTVEASRKYTYDIYKYGSTTFNCVVNRLDVPKTISLSYNCSLNNGTVLEVSKPEKPKGPISVCLHAIYGFPDPKLMTEWFEFIKLQGVGRVFIYPVNHENFVDERSIRVFEYYKNQGLVNLIPYALRQFSTYRKRFNARNGEMYSDEILPVFDCFARSALYKYIAYIDFDEVIMFHSNPLDLVGNLDKLFKDNSNAGMFVFKMESFVLNWTVTHNSDLIMMKYINRTEALDDRKKMVYINGRYKAIAPHTGFPAAGHRRVLVPESIGAIHHYRTCRLGWTDDYCLNTTRYRDDSMIKFESILNESIKHVPEHIRNG